MAVKMTDVDRSHYYMPSSCLHFTCVSIIPPKHVTINNKTIVGHYFSADNVIL